MNFEKPLFTRDKEEIIDWYHGIITTINWNGLVNIYDFFGSLS
jgi:hypothetical protein